MFEHLLDGHKSPAPIDSAKVEDTGEPVAWRYTWKHTALDWEYSDQALAPHSGMIVQPLYAASTAPTTGSAAPVLRCACGNIAESRDAHVDALRCKSCWARFAAPTSPAASAMTDEQIEDVLAANFVDFFSDGTVKAETKDLFNGVRRIVYATRDAAPSDASMPNLDGDWSPISETLVHRLRDLIPAQALADMPERMAEAINVIREEAAHAIESLCGQFRELEYIMECSKNAKSVAALNLNLESGLGDGGLLNANIEAARATPAEQSVPVAIPTIFYNGDTKRDPALRAACDEQVRSGMAAATAHRDSVIEECAMVCRKRINGTRRVADLEAAECMRAIRALKSQQDAAIESQRSRDGS